MKNIIILDGIATGKTQFIEFVKSNNYWCWNINSRNVLSFIAHKLGWNGQRNENYFNFIASLEQLANTCFDYNNWYYHDMIAKFDQDERVNLLIIHNCKEELRKNLLEKLPNCNSVLIVQDPIIDETYNFTLNYKSENYNKNILRLLEKLGEKVNAS